jgi:non-heme chloroperoxidase
MNYFTTKDQTQIFYKDIGRGVPVILIHGWPLSADMWDEQTFDLLNAGFRVISYDRRGFGRSEQPATGYDYDTFASDLNDLITELALDKVSLVGFSMGGGEIARYLSKFGAKKVACASLISSVTPIVMQTPDNPAGVPDAMIREIEAGVRKDRFSFFNSFFKDFYGVSLVSHPVSAPTLAWAEMVASQASLKATYECVNAFGRTDFRPDMKAFTIPTLIIHGTADKTVPLATAGEQAARMIPSATYKPYDGAPHGLNLTHKDMLNRDLLSFLKDNTKGIIASEARKGQGARSVQPH